MGTKRQLAGRVAALVEEAKSGPFLDLFSGMCAVGSAVGRSRQVWSNDAQIFASEVARAHFCTPGLPPDQLAAAEGCRGAFQDHFEVISQHLAPWLEIERIATQDKSADELGYLQPDMINAALSAHGLGSDNTNSYTLFVSRYAGAYFGVRQSIEIDALRRAIDLLPPEQWTEDDRRWLVLALCRAVSKCAATTGHFAQPMKPKASNVAKFSAQRRRSIWGEWVSSVGELCPIGSASWRRNNQVFRSDALDILTEIGTAPSVIYADPPYTSDQYSRYYHIYETLVSYDYPSAEGVGLYREDRFVSQFSLKARVRTALYELISRAASLGADLILSYPKNGLLPDGDAKLTHMMNECYGAAPERVEIPYSHSTMGGSKGPMRADVIEVIYFARA
jgi:adenine-specific DNA-methyltransferase